MIGLELCRANDQARWFSTPSARRADRVKALLEHTGSDDVYKFGLQMINAATQLLLDGQLRPLA